jgi:small ligand-binding sensory domain FIST
MEWASAVSERVDTREAVREAALALRADRARPPDLVLAFVSPHHAANYSKVPGWVYEHLQPGTFAGCSAAGVIGGGRELENREAVSLTAAWLPDSHVFLAYLEHNPEVPERVWPTLLNTTSAEVSALITLVDPYSFDAEGLLDGLDRAFPGTSKLGGLVSGGAENRAPALFAGTDVHREGALVLALSGEWDLRTVVAQGCRPVGEPYIVTRAKGNVIRELNAGKPAEVLRRVYDAMNARDHSLFNTSLFLGIDLGEEQRSRYAAGDFLIRNVLGIDPDSGAMAIDAKVRDYQVVQFHLRDSESSGQDLVQRLRALTASVSPDTICGALLFSCLGRGERLYGSPNHDSNVFAQRIGAASLSGFFSNGEIGPLGDKTYLHGYTSVFAVFCERKR